MLLVYALADLLSIFRIEPPRPILPLPLPEPARRQVADTLALLPAHITL